MKVQKSKLTLQYNIATVLIALMLLYIFIIQGFNDRNVFGLSTLFLFLCGILATRRAFLIDKLRRSIENKDYINFWKYCDDTDIWTLGIDYLKITPIIRKYNEVEASRLKIRINLLTILIYLSSIFFIWTQIGRRWHYL